MKSWSIGIILCFLFLACEEIPPIINPIEEVIPEEATTQTRQILIEEFTGVRCVNCPAGSQAIEDLINIYGERLVVVSIHSGSFSTPYEESQIDFRMPDAEALLDFIGIPLGYPTASINRKIFPGERDLQLEGRNKWAGYVASELQTSTKLNLTLSVDYDQNSRNLSTQLNGLVVEELDAENLRATLLIIENNVNDTQLTPEGIQNDYTHQHVLRKMLTNPNGNLLTGDFSVGQTFSTNYSATLDDNINPTEAKIIAFVSLSGVNKEVLQSVQESLIK